MLDHDSTIKNPKFYRNHFIITATVILLTFILVQVAAGQITLIGQFETPGWAFKVTVKANYAYVADRRSGLQVIDISDPTSPSLTGNYDVPRMDAFDVAVSDSYAYVASGYPGLLILDISNPSSPTLFGSVRTYGDVIGVALLGNYAYVVDFGYGLQIIDITDPTSPSLVGYYNAPGGAWDVAVKDGYAYVAYGYDTGGMLRIVNISHPASPSFVCEYNTPNWVCGVCVDENYIYLVDKDRGLNILEFTCNADVKGNVNNDCVVDAANAIRAVNIILKTGPDPTPHELWAADCNGPRGECKGDGVINVLDVVKIVRSILDLEKCP